MKDVLLVIVLLVAVGLSAVVVRFNEKATKAGKNLEEERYSRMVMEETLQKKAAELATLRAELKSDQSKMAKIEGILDQEQGVNADLKTEYEKLAKSKAELEAKLQTVLHQQQLISHQPKADPSTVETAEEKAAVAVQEPAGPKTHAQPAAVVRQ